MRKISSQAIHLVIRNLIGDDLLSSCHLSLTFLHAKMQQSDDVVADVFSLSICSRNCSNQSISQRVYFLLPVDARTHLNKHVYSSTRLVKKRNDSIYVYAFGIVQFVSYCSSRDDRGRIKTAIDIMGIKGSVSMIER
jgi:hypothetical protein